MPDKNKKNTDVTTSTGNTASRLRTRVCSVNPKNATASIYGTDNNITCHTLPCCGKANMMGTNRHKYIIGNTISVT